MELGKTQELQIKAIRSPGAILTGDILLPKKYVPDAAKPGDRISVFLLRDSEDRLLATTRKPKVQVGEFAFLKVNDVSRVGAFLDWGMEKDLFLPFREQLHKVKLQETVLVYCYLDKSNRIAATMRVKEHFSKPVDLKENDWVDATVYSVNPEIGAFVLVQRRYNGLIPREKMTGALMIGQKLNLRVERIKPDGKLDLSMQPRAHEKLDADATTVYQTLQANRGYLRVNDHSQPAQIQALFGMSKAQFKRAVGRLLKRGAVQFADGGIRIVRKEWKETGRKKDE